jgi:hypothetical protein
VGKIELQFVIYTNGAHNLIFLLVYLIISFSVHFIPAQIDLFYFSKFYIIPLYVNIQLSNYLLMNRCLFPGFCYLEGYMRNWVWWYTPVFSVLQRLRHKNHELKAFLGYIVRS